jgi:hypothetical protein
MTPPYQGTYDLVTMTVLLLPPASLVLVWLLLIASHRTHSAAAATRALWMFLRQVCTLRVLLLVAAGLAAMMIFAG